MQEWLTLFRVRLLPTAWSNAFVGSVVAAGWWNSDLSLWLPLGVSVTALYLFGMAQNDYADRVVDTEIHPARPLPRATISPKSVRSVLVGLLLVGLASAALLGLTAFLVCSVMVTAIVLYNLLAKSHALFGPLCMGTVRGSLVFYGGCATVDNIPMALVLVSVTVGLYVAVLTAFSQEEERARPDILRKRGRTILWTTFAMLLILHAFDEFHEWNVPGVVGFCLMILWTGGVALAPLRRDPVPASLVTLRCLLGLLVLDLAILLTYHHLIPAILPASLLVCCLGSLLLRTSKTAN